MKILIDRFLYIGFSNRLLLPQYNEAIVLDIILEKITVIDNQNIPIEDKEIKKYLYRDNLNFKEISNKEGVCKNPDFVIIASQYTNMLNNAKNQVYNYDLLGDSCCFLFT